MTPALGGTASALGGTASALGGTASALGGTASARGGTASARGGTAPALGDTAPALGGTASVTGDTAPGLSDPARTTTSCDVPSSREPLDTSSRDAESAAEARSIGTGAISGADESGRITETSATTETTTTTGTAGTTETTSITETSPEDTPNTPPAPPAPRTAADATPTAAAAPVPEVSSAPEAIRLPAADPLSASDPLPAADPVPEAPPVPEIAPTPVDIWDDGLIARRVAGLDEVPLDTGQVVGTEVPNPGAYVPDTSTSAYESPLRDRLDALRELVGLSRARLEDDTLAEAGRVLDAAEARRRLSDRHTVVAIAGATGSGKSTLFNALAGVNISDTGVRRPTTAAPLACSWTDGAAGLLDRLAIPGRLRRRPLQSAEQEKQLTGLVLLDLPDHDSAALQHRDQVDRILTLVDAVIWVVDPEKYADAVLHERYLRPMAGHAEVTFVVLNQVDRLPGDCADQVLDDLRRLLDEDGVALGEHGEPGATVLSLSALTGEGVGELREALGQLTHERGAAARRIAADLDAAAAGLRPVYTAGRRVGLSEEAREEFADRLAEAVGAVAAGQAAERAWRRNAGRACGTPWLRLWHRYEAKRGPQTGSTPVPVVREDEEATARQRVEQAVRTIGEEAAGGLPAPWALAVREAASRGAQGLPETLDQLSVGAGAPVTRPPRPGWWPVAVLAQAAMTLLQVVGAVWLVGQAVGVFGPGLVVPVLLMVAGIAGGPCVEWACRMAARGPARRYGLDAERRLREAAAGCGRAGVLDPVAAELLRYREVREQYVRVTGTGGAHVRVTEFSTTGQ
ncbi:GTPase [Streptomyces tsukubensis]|uniref:GTPase n=1 Tax=Streptomyces tsukubensis TaxID=83656 RepID=UPI0021194509|nr:GTPase [Streptomyces tsukubensis]